MAKASKKNASPGGTLRRYLPALFSGTVLIFAFPRFDLYGLAFIALVPFLVSMWGKSKAEAFKAGVFLGVPYFFGTQYWIYHSMNHYGGIPLVASFFFVLLLSLYLSLYTGLFGLLFSWKLKDSPLPALFLAPVFWVVLEFARSYALTGFPWSSIGYSQWKFLPLIQIADITGVYGVSFIVVAVNGALADLFIAVKRRREMPLFHLALTTRGFALLVLAIAAVFMYGTYRLNEKRPGKDLTVAIVQGNIEQDRKWDPRYQQEVLDKYKSLTAAAISENRRGKPILPVLIVWPETAVPFYWGSDKDHMEELVEFQKELDAYLLFGAVTVKGERRLANSAVLLDKNGNTAYVYDKIHLVPFGEYVPLKRLLFFVNKITYGIGDYVPGNVQLRAETPAATFGTLICYEIIFPGLVRKIFVKNGDAIVTITNDAWFGRTSGPYQHWSMAALRAVENRKPVIRAANTGISGFMDSNGGVIASTPLFEPVVLSRTIRTDGTRSFYSRFGDLFSYFAIVITIYLIGYRRK